MDVELMQIERDEWRTTARSEMAGRAAAEARVRELEALIVAWFFTSSKGLVALEAEARRIREREKP